jgi:hypothetical protein
VQLALCNNPPPVSNIAVMICSWCCTAVYCQWLVQFSDVGLAVHLVRPEQQPEQQQPSEQQSVHHGIKSSNLCIIMVYRGASTRAVHLVATPFEAHPFCKKEPS